MGSGNGKRKDSKVNISAMNFIYGEIVEKKEIETM